MSVKAMWMMIQKIHAESHVSRLFILCDMVWCAVHYGVGYLEYRVFGWVYIRGKKRKTFMTMQDNLRVCRLANDKAYLPLFEDKLQFNEKFREFVHRDFLDLRKASFEEFQAFCQSHLVIFVKETDGFGGVGARKLSASDYQAEPSCRALYQELKDNRLFVVEECVVQCEKMNLLCPASINTLRMVTVLAGGKPYLMYTLVRMGNGTKAVDNISSGGMYAPVDENGVIFKPAFCDKTGELYEIHPFTKTKLVGFQIPFYAQAVEMVFEAAQRVPQVGYVGWDVAMAEDGPLLIEGNTMPGYDMPQNYYHLRDEKAGILSRFQEVLGERLEAN